MQVSSDQLGGKARRIYDELPEGEREVYLEALASPRIPAEVVSRALEKFGHSISPSLIRTIRRDLRARQE